MAAQRETAVQPAPMEVPAVAVTHIGLRAQSRVAFVVARRELRIYGRDRARVLSSFTMPLVMMIIFGEGLGNTVGSLAPGVNYREFIFPGILAMSVIMTAMFAGTSVVMDREFGFLREMLVSPASRTAICLGKIVGGGTIATLQSLALFLLAPIIGVDISLSSGLALLGALFLMAMVLASGGVALVREAGLRGELAANPLAPEAAGASVHVELFGHTLSTLEELAIVSVLGLVLLALAVRGLQRS